MNFNIADCFTVTVGFVSMLCELVMDDEVSK